MYICIDFLEKLMSKYYDSDNSGFIEEPSARMNSEYSDFRKLPSGSYCDIFVASRYGKKYFVKTLKPNYSSDPKYQELLQKEFGILMSLQHDSIVKAEEWACIDSYGNCLVMEYIEGVTLKDFIAREDADASTKLCLIKETLRALDYLHGKQIVHRDLKPANIMVMPDRRHIKILDFGLSDSSSYEILKQAAGTPGYLSPEQQCGGELDIRNDIYSVGCIMRDMNLGKRYRSLVKWCLDEIDKRPRTAWELLKAIEKKEKKNYLLPLFSTACIAVFVGIVVFLITNRYAVVKEQSTKDTIVHVIPSTEQKDTISDSPIKSNKSMFIGSKQGTEGITPEMIAEGKRLVEKEVKEIEYLIDTVQGDFTTKASAFAVRESQATSRIYKYAQSKTRHLGNYYTTELYDQLCLGISNNRDRWYKRLKNE